MTDDVTNLVLEHLRHIRGKVDATALDIDDLKTRMTAVEIQVSAMNRRMDRLDERTARIERRLELADA
ncbi:MAG TPA: hypothetical protein VHY79_00315 [Rhizomicrobium sp.]|jgi:predicted  nucleic acid-binding Zn-ribbon protein|nr:hypothetical protein [Rhizomicrobium sp.]